MPYRFGPTRFGPPFSKVWQAAHFLAAAAPFSTEAVCSSFSIGSDGAAASASAPVRLFLHGDFEARLLQRLRRENRPGSEVRHQEKKAGAENRTENFIEFEGVHFGSGSRPLNVDLRPAKRPRDSLRNQAFTLHPRAGVEISVCPRSGNPYKRADFRPIPTLSARLGRASNPMTETRTLVLIPARMAATRLPGKPLLDIAGLPMIVHVLRRAEEADIGRVAVATDTPEIAAAVKAHGGEAVMTRPDHPSGSDRIFEALDTLDPDGGCEIVVNVQGDFPTISPDNIRAVLPPLADPAVDIATLAAEIHTEEESTNPNVVKAVGSPIGARRLRALYFTRATAPSGDGPRYHHIGLYAYRRAALERFVRAAAVAARTAGEARAVAGAGSRHADRRHHRRHGAARRRYRRPTSKPLAKYWPKPERLLKGAHDTKS